MIEVKISYSGENPERWLKRVSAVLETELPPVLANRFKDMVVTNIETNKFDFKLSKAWSDVKRMKGWSDLPFVAEGYYKSKIAVASRKGNFEVGFPEGLKHPRSGKDFLELANMLEFGRDRLPARPLWRESTRVFIENLENILKEELRNFDVTTM